MPSYIRIEGTKEQLLGITDISGLQLRQRTADQMESGNWEVYAYATAASITEIQSRGPTVEVLATEEDVNAHLASLDEDIGKDSGIV